MKKTIKKYIEVFQPKEYGMIDLVVKIGEEWNLSKEIFDKIYEKKFSTLIELNQKENKDIEQTLTTIFYNFSGGRDRKISKFKKNASYTSVSIGTIIKIDNKYYLVHEYDYVDVTNIIK